MFNNYHLRFQYFVLKVVCFLQMKVYYVIRWIYHRERSYFLCTHSLLLLNIIVLFLSYFTNKAEQQCFSFSRNQLSSLLITSKVIWMPVKGSGVICKPPACFVQGFEDVLGLAPHWSNVLAECILWDLGCAVLVVIVPLAVTEHISLQLPTVSSCASKQQTIMNYLFFSTKRQI